MPKYILFSYHLYLIIVWSTFHKFLVWSIKVTFESEMVISDNVFRHFVNLHVPAKRTSKGAKDQIYFYVSLQTFQFLLHWRMIFWLY